MQRAGVDGPHCLDDIKDSLDEVIFDLHAGPIKPDDSNTFHAWPKQASHFQRKANPLVTHIAYFSSAKVR